MTYKTYPLSATKSGKVNPLLLAEQLQKLPGWTLGTRSVQGHHFTVTFVKDVGDAIVVCYPDTLSEKELDLVIAVHDHIEQSQAEVQDAVDKAALRNIVVDPNVVPSRKEFLALLRQLGLTPSVKQG